MAKIITSNMSNPLLREVLILNTIIGIYIKFFKNLTFLIFYSSTDFGSMNLSSLETLNSTWFPKRTL